MKLFGKKQKPDGDGYYETAVAVNTLQPNQMTPVKINNQKIILTQYEQDVIAFSAICPHAAANLTQGDLHRWKVTCPDHGYCFDIRNGRLLWPEDEVYRLKRYEVKIEGEQVKVRL